MYLRAVSSLGDLPALEVAIGLAFLFFVLSTACSAINEGIANLLGWRAKTLEDGVRNLLGDKKVRGRLTSWAGRLVHHGPDLPEGDLTTRVFQHWKIQTLVRDPDSAKRRRARPSYLPPRALSLAVTEVLAAQAPERKPGASLWKHADAEIMGHVDAGLAALPQGRTREALQTAATRAGGSLEDFRAYVEHGFDDAMERASGWYKRKVQTSLAVIAAVLTLGLNIDTAHVAGRLWTDGPLRSAVVARASHGGQPSDAASAVADVHELGLPIGWNAGNRPSDIGGAIDEIPGWLITIAALNLGAPFWFDLLSRLARLRGSGVAEPPRSLSDKAGAKAVEPRRDRGPAHA